MKMIITDDEGFRLMINPMHIVKVENSCDKGFCFIHLIDGSNCLANEDFAEVYKKINEAMGNK